MTKRLTIALVALAMFVLVAVMPVAAYTVAKNITQGATVFIGEQGLNISSAMGGTDTSPITSNSIGWWASAAVINTTAPGKAIPIATRYTDFLISPGDFVGYTGNWYRLAADGTTANGLAFQVLDPQIDVSVYDFVQATSVSGKSVPQGSHLGFSISTNMYQALGATRNPVWNNITDGYIDIVVKTESGATLVSLLNGTAPYVPKALKQLNVTTQPYYWGCATYYWVTDALDTNGQLAYPTGTYTVSVASKLNNMKDNYQSGGADYTGKTVSQSYTVTLVSDTVKIVANKDSVVRSKPFAVTITGRPSEYYYVWVKGANTLTGGYDNQPPLITLAQDFVNTSDPLAATYKFQNSANTVAQDAGTYDNGQRYARIKTGTAGTRVVQFDTTNFTKAQKYTIRVEETFPIGANWTVQGAQVKSDEVDVKVEKGAVTIVAAGDQSYYLGEEIKFSGTNTESYKTYLLIIGPNLDANGARLLNPHLKITSGTATTFESADVLGDNTWSYKWATSSIDLDAGTYTIYAISQPVDKSPGSLATVAYGTVSIIIKKPFISATASQSTVAKGDKIFVTGTAEGKPSSVQLWILGKNFATTSTESVQADSSFSYEIKQGVTQNLYSGQYFVVAQHPMQNNVFDIYPTDPSVTTDPTYVVNRMLNPTGGAGVTGTNIFKLRGLGSLQGTDAAEALVQGINDPNVDDSYTKLQFLVEEPVIRIDAIGDRHVGDKFTIIATTNLAVDDEILFEVYSSSFKPTQKSQSGEFSGATGTQKVVKGDSGLNKITFDVDAATFKPDEYIVKASAVIQVATGSALFNVLEGAAPTAVPTVVKTTAAPTAVATTAAPTVAATPTKTPTQPGFGALVALIGLGAVAFLVVRRH